MAYTKERFKRLTASLGEYGSWAVWDDQNLLLERLDPKVLHADYVIVGLNISRPLFSRWSNFRGGLHDKKLKELFNSKPYIGCYMTDLVKCIESKSNIVGSNLLKEAFRKTHIKSFRKEMLAIGVNKSTKFILLGDIVQEWFSEFINDKFKYNKVYNLGHYSNRFRKKEDWLAESKKRLKAK